MPKRTISFIRRVALGVAIAGLVSCDKSSTGGGSGDQVFGPVVLPAETKVLSSAALSSLPGVVSADQPVLEFRNPGNGVGDLRAGDILVGGVSENSPTGLLRRITAVEASGGTVRVTTAPATLEEAIKEADVHFARTLTPGDLASTSALRSGVSFQRNSTSAAAGSFSLLLDEVVLYDEDGNESTKDDQITASGTVSFDPTVDLDLKFKDLRITHARFAAKVSSSSTLEFTARVANQSLVRERVLARHTFQPITIMVGPLPVVILPVLEIRLGANGEISAGLKKEFSYAVSAGAAAEYASGQWTGTQELSREAHAGPVRAFAKVNAEGYLSTPLTLNLYGGPGPYAEPRVFLAVAADPLAVPWWTLDWGVRMRFGVRSSLLGRTLKDYDVPAAIEYRARIAQASGAFDGTVQVSVTPSPSSMRVGETQRLTATVTAGTDTIRRLPVQWTSSNSAVATVDTAGVVTGVRVGAATVTARVTGGAGESAVSVTPKYDGPVGVRWRFKPSNGEVLDYAIGPSGTVYAVVGTWNSVPSRLYALDRQTGTVLWVKGEWEFARGGPVVSDDETVYVTGTNGFGRREFIAAFDGHTGQVKWHSSGPEAVGRFGVPLLGYGGRVFVPSTSGGGGVGDGSMWAFETAGGQPVWHSESPPWPQWAHLGAVGSNGMVYATADSSVYAIRASSGQTAWRFVLGPQSTYQNVVMPPAIGPDGTVYVSEYGPPRPLTALDGETGTVRWRVNDCRMSSLILAANGALVCAGDGLIAVNPRNGARMWSFREGQMAVTSHAATSDNTVVLIGGGNPNWTLYAVDAANGALKWQWTNEPAGEPRGSVTVASGGRVYVGFRFQLVALDTSLPGLAQSGWPMIQHDPAKSSRAR